jgi:hypothetical protein
MTNFTSHSQGVALFSLHMQAMAALLGQPWQQSTIEAALVALRGDVNVAPTAPGGRGEYRNSLAASFLYKFYVHVSRSLMFDLVCGHIAPGIADFGARILLGGLKILLLELTITSKPTG